MTSDMKNPALDQPETETGTSPSDSADYADNLVSAEAEWEFDRDFEAVALPNETTPVPYDQFPTVDEEIGSIKTPVALYALDDVRAALGLSSTIADVPPDESLYARDTEHQSRLSSILDKGEEGRWRHALGPSADADAAIAALMERAPHFAELGDMLRVNIRAARNIGLPMFLNPVLLVGAAGIGKTWILSRASRILGLPFRSYSMSISTLGEGLQGSHPSWRNSAPGLVAKTLLRETAANPILAIDEFDKVSGGGSWNFDPYRPFYILLDPSGSRAFTDEYLGFEIDASKVLWIMACNDISGIPAPILDRLTMLHVPEPSPEQRLAIIQSIYAEANALHRDYFEPELERSILEKFSTFNPRSIRLAIEAAMARAASKDSHVISEADISMRETQPHWRAGFC